MQHFWNEVYVSPQDSKANARESKWTTLAELSQYFHYRSLLAGMQPDAAHMQKHSHTLQDRRYRARFSYKFPLGEHQTPPVVCRSSPPRLFHSPSLAPCSSIFILSILFLWSWPHTLFSLRILLIPVMPFLITDIFQETCNLCEYVCELMWDMQSAWFLEVNKCQPAVLITVCVTACVCNNEIGLQRPGLLSYEESDDAHHQLYIHTKHTSAIIHADWGLPPDLTH